MCNLSERIAYESERRGERRGEQRGKLQMIKNLMTNANMPAENAMDLLGIPASEQPIYLKFISDNH